MSGNGGTPLDSEGAGADTSPAGGSHNAGPARNLALSSAMDVSDPADLAMLLEALGQHRNWLQQRANGSEPYPRELRPEAEVDLERARRLLARIRAAQTGVPVADNS
jgi:hypothetical protein